MEEMRQVAPYPRDLLDLVQATRYKPDWVFTLADVDRGQGSIGLTLVISIQGPDTYHPERVICVNHYMIVPSAAYDRRSWCRWLFEQILSVERHEAMEWFALSEPDAPASSYDWRNQVSRPYAPSHGPGNDPYLIRELGTQLDQRTSFRGEVSDR